MFTEDGVTPIDSAKRMHRLRRSFAKSWRNAKWRDMLLAFLHWLSDGDRELLAWCEAQGVEYVLGIAQNPRLKRNLAPELERARQECERTGQAARAAVAP